MKYSVRDLQARLSALGFHPGPIDNVAGARTYKASNEAREHFGVSTERELFHHSGIHRIHWHWTAGAYGVIDVEEDSYNSLGDQHGNTMPGHFPPEAQANYAPGRAASHTRNANSGALSHSMDCMAGAVERPFDAGKYPMTWGHVEGLVTQTALWCDKYWIPVSRFSTLSHAEIQPTLGIKQRFKWDISWLPDMDRPGDPIEVGDRLRSMVASKLQEIRAS